MTHPYKTGSGNCEKEIQILDIGVKYGGQKLRERKGAVRERERERERENLIQRNGGGHEKETVRKRVLERETEREHPGDR